MSKSKAILLAAVAFTIGALFQPGPTTAAPAANIHASSGVLQSNLDFVRWYGGGWRGGYWRGGGWGWGWGGFAGGLAAGAIVGGMLAAPYYYPPPYYYGPPAGYGGPPDDAVAYCMQRFKSYDPGSGTYLGYDGYRHPCP